MTDKLTGLLTRKSFFEEALKIKSDIKKCSVVVMKIAHFKNVNDGLGDELGDKVIVQIAKRLKQTFINVRLIGRMSGGNFSLLFEELSSQELEHEILRLRDFVERPLLLKREVIVLNVNIGVVDERNQLDNISEMIHAAEVALHNAMSSRVKISYFDSAMKLEAQLSHQLENALRVSLTKQATEIHRAIHSQEFFLVFQPIMNIKYGYPSAFEALLRWNHPEKGIISPATFIPIAEQIGVMELLGRWVLRRACKEAADWPNNSKFRSPKISVNISPMQLRNRAAIVETVKSALEESGLEADRLKLEITESQEISHEMIETVHALKRLGCWVAIDDFGTGYSSLMELNTLPVDYVKLDRSFIKSIGGSDEKKERQSLNMIRAVVSLIDVFNLIPIVEGVETSYQLTTCTDAGINLVQGFYFSKPLDEKAVQKFLLQKLEIK